mgnify:CR=1 FL=1
MQKYTFKDYLTLNGLVGFLIAIVGLLAVAGILLTLAINVQQNEATNYYSLNQDIDAIKAVDSNNIKHYQGK